MKILYTQELLDCWIYIRSDDNEPAPTTVEEFLCAALVYFEDVNKDMDICIAMLLKHEYKQPKFVLMQLILYSESASAVIALCLDELSSYMSMEQKKKLQSIDVRVNKRWEDILKFAVREIMLYENLQDPIVGDRYIFKEQFRSEFKPLLSIPKKLLRVMKN